MKKEKTKPKDEIILEKNTSDNKNGIVENEEKSHIDEQILEREMRKKRIPKEILQEILKKIFKNLIIAIVVMIYFISTNILYTKFDLEKMERVTQIFSGVFILSALIVLEIAYKKDSGTLTITAIELLILSMHALFIHHVITIYNFEFRVYLLTSSYIFAIYYVLKSIVIYTKARMKYLKSLSDVPEIVKDEPIIKEAKKRKNREELFERVEKMIIKQEEEKIDVNEEKSKSIRVKNRKTNKKTHKGKCQTEKDENIKKKEIEEDNENLVKEDKKVTNKGTVNKKKEEVEQAEEKQIKPKSKRGRKKKVETEK